MLGNRPASGTTILDELGEEHLRTGAVIVYTSGDSVFQIAAHENVVPLAELYKICEIARRYCDALPVARVIARPFVGTPGAWKRTYNRRDFSMPPPSATVLDEMKQRGLPVVGVGKISDIFAGQGVTENIHSEGNLDGLERTLEALDRVKQGLVFLNLVDFDMLYGHRRDPAGYYRALQEFDAFLPKLVAKLGPRDLMLITADHGNDPTLPRQPTTRASSSRFSPSAATPKRAGPRRPAQRLLSTSARRHRRRVRAPTTSARREPPAAFVGIPFRWIRSISSARSADKYALSADVIQAFIRDYSADRVPDYQASALLMARSSSGRGPRGHRRARRADGGDVFGSGDVRRPQSIAGAKIDKHSTGGSGRQDLDPLSAGGRGAAASLVPMISGRGLRPHRRHDSTSSRATPAFRVDLDVNALLSRCSHRRSALAHRPDRAHRARGLAPLRAARRLRHRGIDPAHRRVDDVEEARRGHRRPRARREGRLGRNHGYVGAGAPARAHPWSTSAATRGRKGPRPCFTDMDQPLGRWVGNCGRGGRVDRRDERPRRGRPRRAQHVALGAEMLAPRWRRR